MLIVPIVDPKSTPRIFWPTPNAAQLRAGEGAARASGSASRTPRDEGRTMPQRLRLLVHQLQKEQERQLSNAVAVRPPFVAKGKQLFQRCRTLPRARCLRAAGGGARSRARRMSSCPRRLPSCTLATWLTTPHAPRTRTASRPAVCAAATRPRAGRRTVTSSRSCRPCS
jgi:hypothetical protein